jgi:hypothetical protein
MRTKRSTLPGACSSRGPAMLKQLRQMAARLLDKHHAAAALFLGEDGAITRPAAAWMQQLAADNYVNGGAWHMDPREHAFREGKRELALEIINSARLDVARLEALTKLEREIE